MVVARSLSEITSWEHSGTQFMLRPLPHRIMLRLANLESTDQVELLIRAGIAGWSNLVQADGTVVSAKLKSALISHIEVKDALTPESLDCIPFQLIGELSSQILKANQLGEEDAKN